jgi:hypothetical protein
MATQSFVPAPEGPPLLISEYLDKAALARELGRTTRSVDRLLLNGGGPPYIRLGNRRLFRREAVRDWLRSRETPASPTTLRKRRAAR